MGIEIEYPLGYASSGDTLFRETDFSTRQTTHLPRSIICLGPPI